MGSLGVTGWEKVESGEEGTQLLGPGMRSGEDSTGQSPSEKWVQLPNLAGHRAVIQVRDGVSAAWGSSWWLEPFPPGGYPW